jgi:hypothetical protein
VALPTLPFDRCLHADWNRRARAVQNASPTPNQKLLTLPRVALAEFGALEAIRKRQNRSEHVQLDIRAGCPVIEV